MVPAAYRTMGQYGLMPKAMLAPGYFVKAVSGPNVVIPAGAALVLGVGGRLFFGGKTSLWTGIASLGLLGVAAWGVRNNWMALWAEEADKGPAQAGARVGESVAQTARKISANPESAADSDKRQVLINHSCYENARRANARVWWWDRVRDPLADCGLTEAQRDDMLTAFKQISRTDRARLSTAYRSPHGSLKDLGDPNVPWAGGAV